MAEDYSSRREKLTNALALVQALVSINDRGEALDTQMQDQNVPTLDREATVNLLFAGAGPPKETSLTVFLQNVSVTPLLLSLDPTGYSTGTPPVYLEFFNNYVAIMAGFAPLVGREPTADEVETLLAGTTVTAPTYTTALADLPECDGASISDRLVNILNGAIVDGIDWTV